MNEKTYDLCFGASVLDLRGRSVYRSLAAEIESEVTVFVPVEKRVKIIRISIKNPMSRPAAVAFFPRIIRQRRPFGRSQTLYADHIEYENVLRTDKRAVLWTVGGSVCDGGVTLAVPEKSCGKAYFCSAVRTEKMKRNGLFLLFRLLKTANVSFRLSATVSTISDIFA